MKTWLVMKIFGHIAVVTGPLPYDIHECYRHQAAAMTEIDKSFKENNLTANPTFRIQGDSRLIHRSDITVECMASPTKPRAYAAWGPEVLQR